MGRIFAVHLAGRILPFDSAAARDYAETVNFSFVDAEWEQDFAGNSNPVQ